MDNQQLILAIIQEAQNSGIAPLLKTALVKYLYLLDVYVAEEQQGKTQSYWVWQFLHYGPFSVNAIKDIEALTLTKKIVETSSASSLENDKDFVLYNIADYQRPPSLIELGIPGSVRLKIQSDMKRYGQNLTKLLDYVYFKTDPMHNAKPGEILNFSDCIKKNPADYRTVQMKKIPSNAIKKTRNKLRELIEIRTQKSEIIHGQYDDIYYSGLKALNEEPLPTGLRGKAKLND
ncbi:Uncharacterised protein [Legionella steigerwaltii]|uniref:Antitoxin SocA-like Panacea domain-containing protein n=1 Tax=Legionella steigerwaltii TaxID=460 RepID=A0A378LCS0_9GAMM|nr:hypothetical protein [Legionella steigerwaltii]KTD79512.1 hypothetical protein Lstg_0728 [Legionella steigerwaltii]STY24603.1 Uncharacterised protein [Legionella steigerwaltii]